MGKGKSHTRRPVHYWSRFNEWWRLVLEQTGRRPEAAAINKWYEDNARVVWANEEMPTVVETRIHAKCLRSVDEVRNYFRQYRAAKRADAKGRGSVPDGDFSDDEAEALAGAAARANARRAASASRAGAGTGAVRGGVSKVVNNSAAGTAAAAQPTRALSQPNFPTADVVLQPPPPAYGFCERGRTVTSTAFGWMPPPPPPQQQQQQPSQQPSQQHHRAPHVRQASAGSGAAGGSSLMGGAGITSYTQPASPARMERGAVEGKEGRPDVSAEPPSGGGGVQPCSSVSTTSLNALLDMHDEVDDAIYLGAMAAAATAAQQQQQQQQQPVQLHLHHDQRQHQHQHHASGAPHAQAHPHGLQPLPMLLADLHSLFNDTPHADRGMGGIVVEDAVAHVEVTLRQPSKGTNGKAAAAERAPPTGDSKGTVWSPLLSARPPPMHVSRMLPGAVAQGQPGLLQSAWPAQEVKTLWPNGGGWAHPHAGQPAVQAGSAVAMPMGVPDCAQAHVKPAAAWSQPSLIKLEGSSDVPMGPVNTQLQLRSSLKADDMKAPSAMQQDHPQNTWMASAGTAGAHGNDASVHASFQQHQQLPPLPPLPPFPARQAQLLLQQQQHQQQQHCGQAATAVPMSVGSSGGGTWARPQAQLHPRGHSSSSASTCFWQGSLPSVSVPPHQALQQAPTFGPAKDADGAAAGAGAALNATAGESSWHNVQARTIPPRPFDVTQLAHQLRLPAPGAAPAAAATAAASAAAAAASAFQGAAPAAGDAGTSPMAARARRHSQPGPTDTPTRMAHLQKQLAFAGMHNPLRPSHLDDLAWQQGGAFAQFQAVEDMKRQQRMAELSSPGTLQRRMSLGGAPHASAAFDGSSEAAAPQQQALRLAPSAAAAPRQMLARTLSAPASATAVAAAAAAAVMLCDTPRLVGGVCGELSAGTPGGLGMLSPAGWGDHSLAELEGDSAWLSSFLTSDIC